MSELKKILGFKTILALARLKANTTRAKHTTNSWATTFRTEWGHNSR